MERSCVEMLVTQSRQRVGDESLEYKVIDRRVDAREGGVVVQCKIAVAPRT